MILLFVSLILGASVYPMSPGTAIAGEVSASATSLGLASVSGNLSLSPQPNGAHGAAMIQPLQLFKGSAFLTCENGYPAGYGGLSSTNWFIGTIAGQRSLYTWGTPNAPGFMYYANFCSKGYNQSNRLMLTANFWAGMISTGGTGASGDLRLGFSNYNGNLGLSNLCGPFADILLDGTLRATGIRIGVATTNPVTVSYGSTTSFTATNKTWFTLRLWTNGSASQTAHIFGGSVSATATWNHVWSVANCAPAYGNEQQLMGSSFFLNAIQNAPSGTYYVATNNITIGSLGTVPWKTRGYVTTTSFTFPSSPATFTVNYLIQNATWSPSLGVYQTAPTGALCPCYINTTAGVNIWTQGSPLTTANGYGILPKAIQANGVSAGISVTLAMRINATDGVPTSYISSITLASPLVWTNPGQGTSGGALTQEGNWLGPLVFIILVGSLGYAIFEGYRQKFKDFF